eukprot:gene3089-1377_t
MVCSLTFIDGQVHFQSKYVLSKHRLEENAKKKFLYAGQMGTRNKRLVGDSLKALSSMVTGKSLNLQLRNPSNTNVFYWGGKLLSLYETSLPYCLDPRNLETLGLDNLNGNLSLGCLGAHFKIDAVNKVRLVCFSQRPGFRRSPCLDVFEFNEDWSLHQKQRRLIEGLNYMHDFALLPEYYIVHITPFVKVTTWLSLKIAAGWTSPGEAMEHHKDLPSKFVIIPRDPAKSDQIVTVDTGTFHIFHFGTAEQEGHLLKFTAPCLGPKFNMDFDSEVWLSNTSVAPGKVTNFVIDLNSKTCKHEIKDDASVEFPTSHPYRQGLSGTRYNYLMANDRPGENIPYRDVIKFDALGEIRQVWYSEGIIGEPTFVPRFGYNGRDHGDEDDGYVLVQLYHPGKHLTSFCVLDAKNVHKGCIAKINLKHHVPYGFHGTFSPEVFVTPAMPILKSKL